MINESKYKELERKVLALEAKLEQRAKEFDCILELSRLVDKNDNINYIITELAQILKKSFRYSEFVEVKISNKKFTYKTKGFIETECLIHSDIIIDGKQDGEIVIVYLGNKQKNFDPFTKEENNLLNIIAERLGKIIERLQNKKRYNELFNTLSDGIMKIDKNGIINEANNEAAKICGYNSPDELIGLPISSLYSNSRKRIEVLEKIREKGHDLYNVEFQVKRKINSTVLCNIRMLYNRRQEYVGALLSFSDITEIKKTEQELIINKEKYKHLVDNSNSLITEIDADTFEIVSCNKQVAKIFDKNVSDLIGLDVRKLIPPDAMRKRIEYGEKALSENKVQQREDKRNGRIYLDNFIPYKANGKRFVQTVSYDITEQKRIEFQLKERNEEYEAINEEYEAINLELRQTNKDLKIAKEKAEESEYRFKTLHNASFGGIGIHDKGIILDCNQGLCDMVGYSYEELIGMNGLLLINESTRDKVIEKINQEYEKPYEAIGVRKNGDEYPMRLESRQIPYKGKIVRVTEFRDISLQKETEQELIKAKEKAEITKERFLNLFENNPVSLWEEDFYTAKQILDKKKKEVGDLKKYLDNNPDFVQEIAANVKVTNVNKISLDLFNVERKEQLLNNLDNIFNKKSYDSFKRLLVNISENKYNFSEETEYVKFTGEIIPAIVQVASSDNFRNSIVSIIDVSELKRIEQELISAKEKAEESDRLKTEFIHNMSHEIRTPMNGILGFSDFLNETDVSPETRQQYISIIQNSGNQLMRIIDDILEISQLGTKQVEIVEQEICLNDFCLEMFSIFDIKAKENNIPLYLKKGLSDEKSLIYTDKTKLNKILSNLLENALKFTKEGFVEFGYKLITKDKKNPQLEMYVKDTGIGIKYENQVKIFERFLQEDKFISIKHGGLGLGLSISKENAQLLGGDITLKSEKNKGSIFYLTIPYKPVKSDAKFEPKTEQVVLEQQDKPNILIAENEEVNYLYLETLIEKGLEINCNIFHAKNGKEAVDMCKENSEIDLILMDLKMPVLDGFEATKQIKEFCPHLPIIAQSAYTTNEDKEKAFSAACDDFITKPIEKEKLKIILAKYLTSK